MRTVVVGLVFAIGCSFVTLPAGANPLTAGKAQIQAMEKKISSEALQRRARSESLLMTEGVPINKHLPVLESEAEVKLRSKEAVALRAMALLTVAVKGVGNDRQSVINSVISEYRLEKYFTPKEKKFIQNPSPTQRERIQFAWRYEAAWALLWALGYVESLEKPTGICDVDTALSFMKARSTAKFLADAKLRPVEEVLDKADRIYRYHWAVVDARINGRSAPAGLDPGVTMERHYALNWLIGYMNQDWDDVTTDT